MTSTTGLVPATEPSAATFIKINVLDRMHHTREQRVQVLTIGKGKVP
jgi:hypothetical protein